MTHCARWRKVRSYITEIAAGELLERYPVATPGTLQSPRRRESLLVSIAVPQSNAGYALSTHSATLCQHNTCLLLPKPIDLARHGVQDRGVRGAPMPRG